MVPMVYLRWYQMGRVFVKRLSITGKGAKKRLTQAEPGAWLLHFTTITFRKVSFQSRFCWPCCRLPLSWLSVPCGTALTGRLCSQCFTFPAPCPALVPLHASTVAGEDGMHPCEGQVAGECKAGRTRESDGSHLHAPGITY